MKNVQFFFSPLHAEHTGSNFTHCIFATKPVPKAELLISSPAAVLIAISNLTQTWVISDLPGPTQQLSDPPGWILPFRPWGSIKITLTRARWCYGFSPTSLHLHFASQLCKVTQVRETTVAMWGSHKLCWSCSMLDSHKSCAWYAHLI